MSYIFEMFNMEHDYRIDLKKPKDTNLCPPGKKNGCLNAFKRVQKRPIKR